MTCELEVRELLKIDEHDTVFELGVFPPAAELADFEAAEGIAEERGQGLSADMIAILGLTENWTVAERIAPALHSGRALRYDVDPRILLLEDIPRPSAVKGAVVQRSERQWLIDTRDHEPALVVIPHGDESLIIRGARGEVRLFVWRHGHLHPGPVRPHAWQGNDGEGSAGDDRGKARAIDATQAREKSRHGDALIVCAYDDPRRCRDLLIEGALPFAEVDFESLPRDTEIIFYSDPPGDELADQRVREYRARGFQNSRVLVGGVQAWKDTGYPMAADTAPENPRA